MRARRHHAVPFSSRKFFFFNERGHFEFRKIAGRKMSRIAEESE